MVAATAVERRNCVFQTSLDFEKNKVLLNLSMYFSKITYHRVYLIIVQLSTYFYEIIVMFVNPFRTEIFMFLYFN